VFATRSFLGTGALNSVSVQTCSDEKGEESSLEKKTVSTPVPISAKTQKYALPPSVFGVRSPNPTVELAMNTTEEGHTVSSTRIITWEESSHSTKPRNKSTLLASSTLLRLRARLQSKVRKKREAAEEAGG
jgi:hypothetical protein